MFVTDVSSVPTLAGFGAPKLLVGEAALDDRVKVHASSTASAVVLRKAPHQRQLLT
jgi:hypothetical protein